MRSTKIGAVALVGLIGLTGLSACGSNNKDKTSSPASAAAPKVLAGPLTPTGVNTKVKLDPKFLAGLTALKLTPGLVGKTTLVGDTLAFPITGGNVTLYAKGTHDPYVEGVVKHDGQGITLTGGGHVVKLENFDVDAGKSMLFTDISVDGKAFGQNVDTFFLDGRTLTYPPTTDGAGNSVLQGTTVTLTADAAGALNKVFGTTALTPFFPVGVATITVKA